ncbi:MAG: hypothetical protein JW780_05845 [Clostridiales bacterium]|nr:hypothetical protein [Clostridiales bacterium]
MKCPKCNTENAQRSVCKNCGLFLYNPDYRNTPKLNEQQLKERDRQTVWRVAKKVLKIISIIITIFVLSFWLFVFLWYAFGI